MIDPAIIVVIRDGMTSLYLDACGSFAFGRNLVWGRDAFLDWVRTLDELEEFDGEATAGAVLDCDADALLWYCEDDNLVHPRSVDLLDDLIAAAWEDAEVIYAEGMADLRIAAGDSSHDGNGLVLADASGDSDPLGNRAESLEDVIFDDGELDGDDEVEQFAWVSFVDSNQTMHHFHLDSLPLELIRNDGVPLRKILLLPSAEVPDEVNVTEGLWIDEPNLEIAYWGTRSRDAVARALSAAWEGWQVELFRREGYQRHCQLAGPSGTPISNEQALGPVLPLLLMTERVDSAMMLRAIGKSISGCAARAVAALTFFACLPFAVFALVSGNWKLGAICIGIVSLLSVAGFQFVRFKFRNRIRSGMAEAGLDAETDGDRVPPVAGPLDSKLRRTRLDDLLSRCGLPAVSAVQPEFRDAFQLD